MVITYVLTSVMIYSEAFPMSNLGRRINETTNDYQVERENSSGLHRGARRSRSCAGTVAEDVTDIREGKVAAEWNDVYRSGQGRLCLVHECHRGRGAVACVEEKK